MARESFEDATEEQVLAIVGGYLYLRYFNPVINLSNGTLFGHRESFMMALNEFIEANRSRMATYFKRVMDVDEVDDFLAVDKYLEHVETANESVTLTCNELALVHDLMVRHLDAVAPKADDPARQVVQRLGPAPPQRSRADNEQVSFEIVDPARQRRMERKMTVVGLRRTSFEISSSALELQPMELSLASTAEQLLEALRGLPERVRADFEIEGAEDGSSGGNGACVTSSSGLPSQFGLLPLLQRSLARIKPILISADGNAHDECASVEMREWQSLATELVAQLSDLWTGTVSQATRNFAARSNSSLRGAASSESLFGPSMASSSPSPSQLLTATNSAASMSSTHSAASTSSLSGSVEVIGSPGGALIEEEGEDDEDAVTSQVRVAPGVTKPRRASAWSLDEGSSGGRDEVHELLVHALHEEVLSVERSRNKVHATVERLHEAMMNIEEHRDRQVLPNLFATQVISAYSRDLCHTFIPLRLQDKLSSYKEYLTSVERMQEGAERAESAKHNSKFSRGSSRGILSSVKRAVKGSKSSHTTYSHRQLDEMGVIARSDIKPEMRSQIKFEFSADGQGAYTIKAGIKGFTAEKTTMTLDELLYNQQKNIATVQVSMITLNVNLLIHLLTNLRSLSFSPLLRYKRIGSASSLSTFILTTTMVAHLRCRWSKVRFTGWSPSSREGHSADIVGGSLLVFGGLLSSGVRTAEVLAFDGHGWTQLATTGEAPSPRCYHCSWTYDGFLFVHGGESSMAAGVKSTSQLSVLLPESRLPRSTCCDDLFMLDPSNGKWRRLSSGLAPLPRKGHSAVVVNGEVVVFGGASSVGGAPLGELFVLNAAAVPTGRSMWAQPKVSGSIPCGRYGHSCSAIPGGRMVLFGGAVAGGLLNDVAVLRVADGVWERPNAGGRPPTPRYGHRTAVVQSAANGSPLLVVVGGVVRAKNSEGVTFAPELHVLNIRTWQWSQVRRGHANPAPRYAMSLTTWWQHIPDSVRQSSSRPALCNDQTERSLLGGEVLMFGGLNRQYCDATLWGLEVDVQRPRPAGDSSNDEDDGDQVAKEGPVVGHLEHAIMRARKGRLRAEARLKTSDTRVAAAHRERDEALAAADVSKARLTEFRDEHLATVREMTRQLEEQSARAQRAEHELARSTELVRRLSLCADLKIQAADARIHEVSLLLHHAEAEVVRLKNLSGLQTATNAAQTSPLPIPTADKAFNAFVSRVAAERVQPPSMADQVSSAE